jgi:sugar (pentulose or hexulose) kinase
MKLTPVIAVFDVGKTNKKLFLFDEGYQIVFERSARFNEMTDEDGFPCENLDSLKRSVFEALSEVTTLKQFEVKAINFSAYGASFVYLGEDGQPVAPLYNYLKPYPAELEEQLYNNYGGKRLFSFETCSPTLGSLNSGLQLYRIKYEQPGLFNKITCALHLPQYLSYLVSRQKFSELTSIGCHTALWDFGRDDYHHWVIKEGIAGKLPPVRPSDSVVSATIGDSKLPVGIGLHDSSAALIPYLVSFNEPFILLSTGTWSISLNPFNQSPLTENELKNDCVNYIQYTGKTVKASRYFIGNYYDEQIRRIAAIFNQDVVKYRDVTFDPEIGLPPNGITNFSETDLSLFPDDLSAYYCLLSDIVNRQKISTELVLNNSPVKQIFVDGGFSQNKIFMHLLARAYPQIKVYAASVPQSTALGTALAIHPHWNSKAIPKALIELKC